MKTVNHEYHITLILIKADGEIYTESGVTHRRYMLQMTEYLKTRFKANHQCQQEWLS